MTVAVAAGACTELESATNLNPEGPPMIRQARMNEVRKDALGDITTPRVFVFGTHDLAAEGDYPVLGANSTATVVAYDNELRVIVDELLVGNYLEEIACRAQVDDDAYSFVPIGTTPDDVAKCAVAKDLLPRSCPGTLENAVCICQIDGGCGETPKGGPVGVLDVNQDGAADDTRFINGAVGLRCGSIDVGIDVNASYWNPSGDQNKPAMGGFDVLGPALMLVPQKMVGVTPFNVLPTSETCGLTFSPDVVDKQDMAVCAPEGGDINRNCSPGDVSAFSFTTEALSVSPSPPLAEGATGIERTGFVVLTSNVPLDMASLATAITMRQGATPFTGFAITLPQPRAVRIAWTGTGLAAMTTYTITIATTLTDSYGKPLPAPISITFTTGAT